MLAGLLKVAASDPKLKGLVAQVGEKTLHLTGIDQTRPWVIGTLAHHAPVLVVTATGREAEDLTAELAAMLGDKVAYLPAWETLPHERLSPGADIVGGRAQVLDRIARDDDNLQVIVTAARGYSQPVIKDVAGREPIRLAEDAEFEFDALTRELDFRAYTHVDMVAKRGEYAIRGGILDVFPTTLNYPVRVEFWGDEITDIRQFSVADQRAIDDIDVGEVAIYPARELPITDAVAKRAGELAQKHPGNAALVELLTKVSEKIPAEGMEALLPELTDSPMVALPELLPADTHVVLVAPEKIRTRIADWKTPTASSWRPGGRPPPWVRTAPSPSRGSTWSRRATVPSTTWKIPCATPVCRCGPSPRRGCSPPTSRSPCPSTSSRARPRAATSKKSTR